MNTTEHPIYEVKANLFKGLAHPHRIRVLEILSETEEASVAEFLADTGLEASHLSQHLSVLRKYRLVTSERRGSSVYYRLAFAEVSDLLTAARSLLRELLSADEALSSAALRSPELAR